MCIMCGKDFIQTGIFLLHIIITQKICNLWRKYEKTNSIRFEKWINIYMHIYIKIGKPYSYWFKMLYWVVFLKKINIWKPKQLFFRKTNYQCWLKIRTLGRLLQTKEKGNLAWDIIAINCQSTKPNFFLGKTLPKVFKELLYRSRHVITNWRNLDVRIALGGNKEAVFQYHPWDVWAY